MGDSLIKGSAFNFINTAFKLSDYAGRVYESDSDHGAFARMIDSVRHDLAEVERLLVLQSVKTRLVNTPGKLPYIRGVVTNAKTALNEIGKWVDRAKADEGTEVVTFEDRVRWIFNDRGKLNNQQIELSKCQQDLYSELSFLSPLEQTRFVSADTPSTKELSTPGLESVVSSDDVISPLQRRRMARKVGKSSTPKAPSREAPGVTLATPPTTSSLIRRPLARKRVGSGNGQISKKEQMSPEKYISTPSESTRLVESKPEVNQPLMSETRSLPNLQSLEISDPFIPASSDITENTNVPVLISSEVSFDKVESLPPKTSETHATRESIDGLPPRPNTSNLLNSDSTNTIQTPALKTPRTVQTWPSTNINPTLFTAQEARRVARPQPFHLPAKPSPHPSILSIGYSPVPSPSNPREMFNHSTPSSISHTRNHSTSLTTLPVPSYPSRLRSLSATNLLGPINPFEYPQDSVPTSPELNTDNTAPPISSAPTQKNTRSGSMSRSQEVEDVATELLRAQSKKRNSLDISKKPLRKPKSFNRPMELPTGFLTFQPVMTSPPLISPTSLPAPRLEQRSVTEPGSYIKFQTIETSPNPPPEVVDTAYQFKSPNPPARPNLGSQDQLNRHAISWPTIPKNAHELPSNERPPSMLYTNKLPLPSPPSIPSLVPPHIPMNTSFYAPSPRLYHPTSTVSLPGENGWDLRIPSFEKGSSTKTVAEGRRNNRRALMELMERGSYG